MNVSILKLAMTMLPFDSCYPGPYTLPYTFDLDAANNNKLNYDLHILFISFAF